MVNDILDLLFKDLDLLLMISKNHLQKSPKFQLKLIKFHHIPIQT